MISDYDFFAHAATECLKLQIHKTIQKCGPLLCFVDRKGADLAANFVTVQILHIFWLGEKFSQFEILQISNRVAHFLGMRVSIIS